MLAFFFRNISGGGEVGDVRKQKRISKKAMKSTARPLMAYPALPRWKGPRGKYFRPEIMLAAKGMAYETEVRMMKDPANARKAVGLPSGMAPRPVATAPRSQE